VRGWGEREGAEVVGRNSTNNVYTYEQMNREKKIKQRTYVLENSFDSYSVNNSSALQKTQLKKIIRKIFINTTSNQIISKEGLVFFMSCFLYNR
jgi:hypothetical protein